MFQPVSFHFHSTSKCRYISVHFSAWEVLFSNMNLGQIALVFRCFPASVFSYLRLKVLANDLLVSQICHINSSSNSGCFYPRFAEDCLSRKSNVLICNCSFQIIQSVITNCNEFELTAEESKFDNLTYAGNCQIHCSNGNYCPQNILFVFYENVSNVLANMESLCIVIILIVFQISVTG